VRPDETDVKSQALLHAGQRRDSTSFLGAQTLRAGGPSAATWIALMCFFGVDLAALAMLWPRGWEFTASLHTPATILPPQRRLRAPLRSAQCSRTEPETVSPWVGPRPRPQRYSGWPAATPSQRFDRRAGGSGHKRSARDHGESIELPDSVFRALKLVVERMAQGQTITLVPHGRELHAAAALLCSRAMAFATVLDASVLAPPGSAQRAGAWRQAPELAIVCL